MEQGAAKGIADDEPFVLEGLEFVPSWHRPSKPGSLTLLKSRHMVDLYAELLAPYSRPRMVELGISQGGSVALLALLARPERLLAVELAADPVVPLLDALADLGLADSVKPHFGVDQGDQPRLAELVAAEFGDEPLDVVIDDASHRYRPTVASFEVLFPRLRPGGVYVIEDWTCFDLAANDMSTVLGDPESPLRPRLLEMIAEHRAVEAGGSEKRDPPLSRIAVELTLARAASGDLVADVSFDENWIVVHRGPAEVDPEGFRMRHLYPDHYKLLDRPASERSVPGEPGYSAVASFEPS